MGIFDGYQFDPGTFGGGILGLLAQAGAGMPMAPPQGGFPAPTDVSAAQRRPGQGVTLPDMSASGFGRNPGQPNPFASLFSGIGDAVGGLLGGGGAQAAPEMQGAQQAPQAPQAPGPGLLDRLTAGAGNFTTGGNPLAGLLNSISGLATGQRTDPAGMMQQNIMATYQALKPALIAKGATPEQAEALARAAATDPEIKKTIASTLYQTPQLVSGGTNPLTGEVTHQIYNPNSQTLSNLGPTQGGGAAQTLTPANAAAVGLPTMGNNDLQRIDALNKSGLTGDEYLAQLKAISPAYASKASSMAHGDVAYPSGFIMKTPYGAMLTDSISAIKPGVTAQDFQSKQKARNDFTSGPTSREIKAVNTAIYHADKLQQVSDKMGGFDTLPAVTNPVGNAFKNQVPYFAPGFQEAKKAWDATSETLATEVSKALNGGTPHVADKEHWRAILQGADGPNQRKAAITAVMDILEGRTQAAATTYQQGMQETRDPISFINKENRDKYDKLRGVAASASAAPGQQAPQSAQDQQALAWAQASPNDPRAAKIKQRLGVQ